MYLIKKIKMPATLPAPSHEAPRARVVVDEKFDIKNK